MTVDEPTDPIELPQPRDREAARLARRTKRQFSDDDTAPESLRSSGVEHCYWPTRSQYTRWWMYIVPEFGVLDEGWWYAHCPLHDPDTEGSEVSAQINFKHGMLRCLAAEDKGCHEGKRGITLSNVIAVIVDRMIGDADDEAAQPV